MSMTFNLEKRARELLHGSDESWMALHTAGQVRQTAIQLAVEAADARAEEIAKQIDRVNTFSTLSRATEELCASIARSFISKPKPETREQRMEAALQEIRDRSDGHGMSVDFGGTFARCGCSACIAARALEEKP